MLLGWIDKIGAVKLNYFRSDCVCNSQTSSSLDGEEMGGQLPCSSSDWIATGLEIPYEIKSSSNFVQKKKKKRSRKRGHMST